MSDDMLMTGDAPIRRLEARAYRQRDGKEVVITGSKVEHRAARLSRPRNSFLPN